MFEVVAELPQEVILAQTTKNNNKFIYRSYVSDFDPQVEVHPCW